MTTAPTGKLLTMPKRRDPSEPLGGDTWAERIAAVEQTEREQAEAEQNGPAARLARLRAALVDSAGLDHIPEPVPLVPGVLYRDTLAWIYGAPGCGKSFTVIDLAGCVATGEPWQGFPAPAAGPVLYLIAEGVSGVKQRVRAWEASHGCKMAGVHFLPVAVQSSNGSEWQALIDLAAEIRPALVIIDTQARVTVGAEENSAKDMGLFVDRIDALRKATGACVLTVHHTGRNGENMRGSIAMDGAGHTLIKVEKADDLLTITCGKQKDAPEFDPIRLRMVPFDSSVILSLTDGPPPVDTQTPKMRAALRTWWDSHETSPVSASVLIEEGFAPKATIYRWLKALVRQGVVIETPRGNFSVYNLVREPSA